MATKTKKPRRRVTTVQLPAALLDRLDAMAQAAQRSRNWIIEECLTRAASTPEEQAAAAAAAAIASVAS